jgi:hypothetical protein
MVEGIDQTKNKKGHRLFNYKDRMIPVKITEHKIVTNGTNSGIG